MKKLLVYLSFIIYHLAFSHAVAQILPVTDPAMKRSLNGEWRLKVVEGISDDTTVPRADHTWGTIPVPGCWEQYGFSKPSYDKARPLTGYYRTQFTVPQAWRGQRIVLRFDGVLYGYDLWVNGQSAGSWRSGYNTALFDITDLLTPGPSKGRSREWGPQQLALRVITQFPGSDFDYNDDWAPCGIFRDVTLMAVPETHLSDLTITTKNTGEVNVKTIVANQKGATVSHEILDNNGRVVGTDRVANPHLWTAETPYLYTLRTTLSNKKGTLQRFEHRFGFRELTIDGNVLKLNGRPIKLRGVTCHSTSPHTVKVVSDDLTLRDMRLMKEASVNYIRTSHYPREPRFYELADSLGFYIIDEVPFGYGDKNLQKEEFYPVLQQRAEATIRRDKNHPSVLIWSLGNENPLTDICIRLGDYVKTRLDPTRPYCYPQVGSYFRRFWSHTPDPSTTGEGSPFPSAAPVYAPHYPTTEQIAGFYQHLDRPVIFTEYCHTLGISFEDHDRQWDIIERTPGIAGGSVWEWVDQGMGLSPTPSPTGEGNTRPTTVYGYEEKVYTPDGGGFEMYGNKGTDGLLYADRTPLPNYYELQRNYARAFVTIAGNGQRPTLVVHNRYDFINLKDNVTFSWALTNDRDTVRRGAFSPACEPHDSTTYTLDLPTQSGLSLLLVDIEDAQGHVFLHQSFVLHKPSAGWTGSGDVATAVQQGPLVRAGRKPTLAEKVTQKGRLPDRYLLPLDNSQVRATVQRQPIEGGEAVSFTLRPDSADVFRAELGLAFLLDRRIDRVQWMGLGPLPSYPGRCQANRYGLWAKHKDDLYFEGNRMGVDAALLTDSLGNGLLVVGDALSLNYEQTDLGLVLTVNAAVSGQGPKFRRTAFPVGDAPSFSGHFRLYRIEAARMPAAVQRLFGRPSAVPAPFRPFVTQYDTYLMKFSDIVAGGF